LVVLCLPRTPGLRRKIGRRWRPSLGNAAAEGVGRRQPPAPPPHRSALGLRFRGNAALVRRSDSPRPEELGESGMLYPTGAIGLNSGPLWWNARDSMPKDYPVDDSKQPCVRLFPVAAGRRIQEITTTQTTRGPAFRAIWSECWNISTLPETQLYRACRVDGGGPNFSVSLPVGPIPYPARHAGFATFAS